MTWNKALPSVGQTAWGTPLDDVIIELREHIDALEAAGGQVAGVSGITTDGSTFLTGQVDLSNVFADVVHFHAGTDITSGTVAIARLDTSQPVFVIKAQGGFGASAGSWPASRGAITTDATRSIIFVGNTDPGSSASAGLMNDNVDLFIQVP